MPKYKVVVADDQKNIQKLLKVNLERAGFEVITANDGVEVLEILEKEKPDLIILDIEMPRMKGDAVLKKIKESEETKEIPVIMLTIRSSDEDIFKGWEYGADAYLTKPFNPAEVVIMAEGILKEMKMNGIKE
jgi:DNA-binding response OmpR family regulator